MCCKNHHYGPYETDVINKLVDQLEDKGLVEDNEGPWGTIIVLSAKPHQEGVPCHEYKWQLCVFYYRLNQVTRPFTFPIPWCDDVVEDIDPDAWYFITMDMDSGYWQVVAELEA